MFEHFTLSDALAALESALWTAHIILIYRPIMKIGTDFLTDVEIRCAARSTQN